MRKGGRWGAIVSSLLVSACSYEHPPNTAARNPPHREVLPELRSGAEESEPGIDKAAGCKVTPIMLFHSSRATPSTWPGEPSWSMSTTNGLTRHT